MLVDKITGGTTLCHCTPLYYVVIQHKRYRVPGKQTKGNADRYCSKLIERFCSGEPLSTERIAFDEYAEKWLDNVASGFSAHIQATTASGCGTS